MLRRLAAFALSVVLAPLGLGLAADERVTLVVPGIQCPMCVERLRGSLGKVDSSVRLGDVGVETKQMPVTYDPNKVTVHQLVQAIADTPGVHGKPYAGLVHVTIEDPAKNVPKVDKALGQVKGVVNYFPATAAAIDSGEIMIALKPLPRQAKAKDAVKASQIGDALEKAGVKFSGLPTGTTGEPVEPDPKKKLPGAKAPAKSKFDDDLSKEKTKPKSKSTRDADRSKEADTEDKPRFEILAQAGGKIYIVDHETKNDDGKELKKFVKAGDRFGDYLVKEIGNDDGLFVVLEHPDTQDTFRVEHEKKNRDKDGEKPKDEKSKNEKLTKPKNAAEKSNSK